MLRIGNRVNIEAAEPPGLQGASKCRVPMRYASETQRRKPGWIDGRMVRDFGYATLAFLKKRPRSSFKLRGPDNAGAMVGHRHHRPAVIAASG